jgi:hypothetical protein
VLVAGRVVEDGEVVGGTEVREVEEDAPIVSDRYSDWLLTACLINGTADTCYM